VRELQQHHPDERRARVDDAVFGMRLQDAGLLDGIGNQFGSQELYRLALIAGYAPSFTNLPDEPPAIAGRGNERRQADAVTSARPEPRVCGRAHSAIPGKMR
jgi:hypothetical protein